MVDGLVQGESVRGSRSDGGRSGAATSEGANVAAEVVAGQIGDGGVHVGVPTDVLVLAAIVEVLEDVVGGRLGGKRRDGCNDGESLHACDVVKCCLARWT